MRFSPVEFLVIAVVVFALFGGALIPKVTKQIKKSKMALKAGVTELQADDEVVKEAA